MLNCVRFLEERVHDDVRLMRVAIQPKLARRSSDHFWREMQRLCSSCVKERKIAVQKWMPEPNATIPVCAFYYVYAGTPLQADPPSQHLPPDGQPHAARADAVKRFSYIFDRHFAVRYTPPAARAAPGSHETGCGAHATARADFVDSGDKILMTDVVDSGDKILSVEDDPRSPDMDSHSALQQAEVEAVADDKEALNKRQRQ